MWDRRCFFFKCVPSMVSVPLVNFFAASLRFLLTDALPQVFRLQRRIISHCFVFQTILFPYGFDLRFFTSLDHGGGKRSLRELFSGLLFSVIFALAQKFQLAIFHSVCVARLFPCLPCDSAARPGTEKWYLVSCTSRPCQ